MSIATGIPGVILFALMVLVLGWVVFANDGWGVFLGLSICATVVLILSQLISNLLFNRDLPELMVAVIVSGPLIGMVIFQAVAHIEERRKGQNSARNGG